MAQKAAPEAKPLLPGAPGWVWWNWPKEFWCQTRSICKCNSSLTVKFLEFLDGLSQTDPACHRIHAAKSWQVSGRHDPGNKDPRDDPQCGHMWWAYWISAFFRSWDQLESGFPGRFGTKPQSEIALKKHDALAVKSSNVRIMTKLETSQPLRTWFARSSGYAAASFHSWQEISWNCGKNHLSRINVFFEIAGRTGMLVAFNKNSYPESWCEIKPT